MTDPHRPSFHLLPSSGWLNDPNGVVQWRGRYHVFYQHNPLAPRWAPPHWAHAVSDDLVRWDHLPVAITPDMPPADEGGCWSGCFVDDDGTPTILYTGVRDGVQATCVATGSDGLVRWRKWPGNPVARMPAELADQTFEAYRDPFVWREGERWYGLVGASLGGVGQVLLYRSDDLRTWTYLHPFVPAHLDPVCDDTGQIWECPNFFALGEAHVLLTWSRARQRFRTLIPIARRAEWVASGRQVAGRPRGARPAPTRWRAFAMRSVIVIEFVTLDGVVQSPGGPDEDPSGFPHGGWIRPYADPVQSAVIRKQMSLPFDLLLGRTTFEIWAPYWPQHPDVWPEVQMATKYVASNTLTAHARGRDPDDPWVRASAVRSTRCVTTRSPQPRSASSRRCRASTARATVSWASAFPTSARSPARTAR